MASSNGEVQVLRRSRRLLKMTPTTNTPKKPQKHLKKTARFKAKTKIPETSKLRNKKRKFSLANDVLHVARDKITVKTSLKNSEMSVDGTNRESVSIPDLSYIEDLSFRLENFIENFDWPADFTKIVAAELEPQIECETPRSSFDSTSTSTTKSSSSSSSISRNDTYSTSTSTTGSSSSSISCSNIDSTSTPATASSSSSISSSNPDSTSTSSTASSSSSVSCSNTSSMSYNKPSDEGFRVSSIDTTMKKGRSLESEPVILTHLSIPILTYPILKPPIVPKNNSTDFCQEKENIPSHFTHLTSSRTQTITSMRLCASTRRNEAFAIFKAVTERYLFISKNAERYLQEICSNQGTLAIYRFSRFGNSIFKCQVSQTGRCGFVTGTGRTEKVAQSSAAVAMIDELTMGNVFGNPVGTLQEMCLRLGWYLPTYIQKFKFRNQRFFTYSCTLTHITVDHKVLKYTEIEQGKSKRSAKRLAAIKMLIRINESL